MAGKCKDFKAWFNRHLKDYAEDIANHGANCGFPHITYYTDTAKLYDQYSDEIWTMAVEDAESFGSANVFEFMAGFNEAKNVGSEQQFKNLMTWYACEKVAREIVDAKEHEAAR